MLTILHREKANSVVCIIFSIHFKTAFMKNKRLTCLLFCFTIVNAVFSQEKYDGVGANLSNIFRLSDAKSRSISPENFNGEKGGGATALQGTGASAARD